MLIVLSFSCKDKPTNHESQYSLTDQIPSDFITFLQRFHQDTVYQINHIVFPLAGEENKFGEVSKWDKDQWKIHRPFNTQLTDYNRQYINLSSLITEVIQDKYGLFRSERRFSKMADEWQLIYYNTIYRNIDSEGQE